MIKKIITTLFFIHILTNVSALSQDERSEITSIYNQNAISVRFMGLLKYCNDSHHESYYSKIIGNLTNHYIKTDPKNLLEKVEATMFIFKMQNESVIDALELVHFNSDEEKKNDCATIRQAAKEVLDE